MSHDTVIHSTSATYASSSAVEDWGDRPDGGSIPASLLDPARVRELSRLRPARSMLDIIGCWIVIVIAWMLVARWTSWWTVALAIPVIGNRSYALFVIGHDGLHRRLFRSRKLNDIVCDLLIYGPIAAITRFKRRGHLEHHRSLATNEDPDLHKHGCLNKHTPGGFFFFLTGLATLTPGLRRMLAPARDSATRAETDPPVSRDKAGGYTIRDVAILVGCQTALVVGLSFGIAWWAYPLLWLVPLFLFTYVVEIVRSFAEHAHPEPDQIADQHRLITYQSNVFERGFFAPMNMNYHAAHHLWPSIPYYNLPIADRELRSLAEGTNLIWRTSYFGFIWSYFWALPFDCPDRRNG